MIVWTLFLLIFSTGCASLADRAKDQAQLAAARDEAMLFKDQRDQCEERAAALATELKKKPKTVTIRVPVPVKELDPDELTEIKRQAFEEAEQKFRARVESEKKRRMK